MAKREQIDIKNLLLPIIVGVLPILAAFLIATRNDGNLIEQTQYHLETESEKITNQIQQETTNLFFLIKELTDFANRHKEHTNAEWEKNVLIMNLPSSMPEIKQVGVLKPNKENNSYTQVHRFQNALNSPESYEDIFERIKPETRRVALQKEQLRHIKHTIEEGVTITTLKDSPEMLILYFPIYSTPSVPISIKERHEKLFVIGFIYLNMDEFLRIAKEGHDGIDLSILRSSNHEGLIPMHYDKANTTRSPLFRYISIMPIMEEHWVITYYSLPNMEADLDDQNNWLIYLAGDAIGVLLAFVFYLIISGRKRAVILAEEMTVSLKKNEVMIKLVLDTIPQFVFWKDTNSIYLGCNENFAKAAGLNSPAEIVGKSDYDMPWAKTDAKAYLADDAIVIKSNKSKFHIIEKQLNAQGETIWLDTNKAPMHNEYGKVIGMLGSFEDVTKQKETQEQVSQERRRLRLAVDSFHMAVWDWNPATDIAHWDDRHDKFLGIKSLGKRVRSMALLTEIMHPDDRETFITSTLATAKKKDDLEVRYRVLRPDGTIRIIHSKGIPVKSKAKGGVEYYGVSFDVTEENKLAQLKANFVSITSHQLRTPLTAIRWFQQIITDNLDVEPLTEKQLKYIGKIEESSTRMLDLVNDLLQVSRIDNKSVVLKPIELALCDSTKQILDQLEMQAKENKIKFDFVCPAKKAMVIADKTFAEQVIQNLSTNAIKYGGGEGKTIKVRISETAKFVKWEITDEGIGLSEEDRGKLFQQFFRSKEAAESKADGSGLGLYIAKAIIEQSGGKMDYISVKGKGSTFWFTLPKITKAFKNQKAKEETEKEKKIEADKVALAQKAKKTRENKKDAPKKAR